MKTNTIQTLKTGFSNIAIGMFTLMASVSDTSMALRKQLATERDGGGNPGATELKKASTVVLADVSVAIDSIQRLREEYAAADGVALRPYLAYLKNVGGQFVENELKEAFLALLPHVEEKNADFFGHFLSGLSDKVVQMKHDAVGLDTKVKEVAALGAGAFSAAADNYGAGSPSYMEHQFTCSYQPLVVSIAAAEVLIAAVAAAEAGMSFMGVTYQEGADTDQVGQGVAAIA